MPANYHGMDFSLTKSFSLFLPFAHLAADLPRPKLCSLHRFIVSLCLHSDDKDMGTVLSGMKLWTIDTCLKFVQHTNESNYLNFIPSRR